MPAPRLVFFTIVANNYMAYARTLMASLAEHHPRSARYVVLCDEPAEGVGPDALAELVPARSLGIAGFEAMAFHYDVMELSTAIKPCAVRHLGERHPGAAVVYLDPDILVAAPLLHVEAALERGASLVLTPHITAPLQDGRHPDDLSIMKSGVYNLGFAAFGMNDECRAFLGWWADRCRRDAVVDIENHKFTDQRWMDMAPAFVRHTYILHNHAYNLAYWNLAHRRVAQRGPRFYVDGEPLRFVHFSGVNPGDRTVFSKHQDRFTPETVGPLRPLLDRYLDQVLEQGWAAHRAIPYAWSRFESGRPVHDAMRRSFRRHEAEFKGDPFAGDGAAFDGLEPSLAALGPPGLTRVAHELWHRRPDLRSSFDIETVAGREAYLRWFTEGGAESAGLDASSVAAARALRSGEALAVPGGGRTTEDSDLAASLPWPPQSRAGFAGPRAELDAWLAESVPPLAPPEEDEPPIPRHLALAWESRDDVRGHFRNRTGAEREQYVVWCVTNGVLEGSVDPSLLGAALGAWLDHVEQPPNGDAPPLTRLMRLVLPLYEGDFAPMLRGFPDTLASRCAAAVWLLICKDRYRWPDGFTAAVDAWARERATPFAEQGVAITRLLYAIWQLRSDVREACGDIGTMGAQFHFMAWMVSFGMRETRLPLAALPEEVWGFLGQPRGGMPGFTMLHFLILSLRRDLQARFRVSAPAGMHAFMAALPQLRADPWDYAHWLARCAPPSRPVPAASPRRVLLTGLVSTASGRGEDVRKTAAALQAHGVPHALLDRYTDAFTDEAGAALSGAEAASAGFAANIVHMNADTALADHMFLRRHGVAAPYTIGFFAWELERFPAKWASAFAFYDEIWASTRFAYEAFRAASPRPVHLVSMPVETPAVDAALTRADFDLPEDRFVFYFGFDYRSYRTRKNPEGAVAAFRRAFPTGKEPVTLFIKTLGGNQFPGEVERLEELADGDPRIILRDCEYTATEVATLVGLCDCFLSLHRSEGFGRGPAEAMLLGRPVIATGYSGNLDFTRPETAFLVNYKLVPVGPDEYPGGEGQVWAEPDIAHAARLMRRVSGDPALARRIATAGQTYVREHYGAAAVGRRYLARLEEIGVLPQAGPAEGGQAGSPAAPGPADPVAQAPVRATPETTGPAPVGRRPSMGEPGNVPGKEPSGGNPARDEAASAPRKSSRRRRAAAATP